MMGELGGCRARGGWRGFCEKLGDKERLCNDAGKKAVTAATRQTAITPTETREALLPRVL